MKFTDIFVRRPVLAMVVSLLIFVVGMRSIQELPVRQFPNMSNTLITVSTSYPGASPELMQGFITYPIEQAVATAEGIDYMTSTSTQGSSTISIYVKLNYDPNVAFTDVMSKVAQVQNQLPKAAQLPVITKSSGSQFDLLYAAFQSPNMNREQLTEYINRVIVPNMETVSGVSQVDVFGGKVFSMRIWLDPIKMAAFHVTNEDVALMLQQNNFQSSAGHTKSQYITVNFEANTDINTVAQFKQMIVRSANQGALVRLQDIAKIELGSQSYDSYVSFNGKEATFIGIQATPTANPLTVIDDVRNKLPQLEKSFPPGMTYSIVYDSTLYIKASIEEVMDTIVESALIVIVVIFLFLGAFRAVLIPVVTIPLSLIGVCTFMLALGYSINLLTLLAMVLAIGLVVDDAIIVVENIHRHLEEGLTPFQAGIVGAREIASPVIVMTLTLACVFAPIGLLGGLTGALFKEFAFTLASSVIISGIIALTLSPMMTSRFLNRDSLSKPLPQKIDAIFNVVKMRYSRILHSVLEYRPAVVVFAVTVLISCFFLYTNTPAELAPAEDQGILFISGNAPQYANIEYTEKFSTYIDKMMASIPEGQQRFTVVNINSMFGGLLLKPWNERKLSAMKINPILQKKVATDAGLQAFVITPPALPGNSGGLPIEFELITTSDFPTLYKYSEEVLAAALKSGYFMYMDSSLKFNRSQYEIDIDQSKAAELGLTMQSIGNALSTALSENYTNYFSMQGESYEVIPQVERQFRYNAHDLDNYYMKTPSGQMVALSSVIKIRTSIIPNAITQFNQLNSATLEAILMPGFSMSQGLKFLENTSHNLLPNNVTYDFEGQSRQYVQEGNALMFVFIFALIIIFLVLSAQFESFRDPWIILISVPMSICGALIPLNLGAATVNIYTQIGLVTLIGLISKHGILMVQFANDLQRHEGLSVRAAIEKAAGIRLRPILMTTFAMVFGVVPLILATGAGAESRFDIGLVIAVGMSIGTLFTLFVLPTMYTLLAKAKPKEEMPADEMDV